MGSGSCGAGHAALFGGYDTRERKSTPSLRWLLHPVRRNARSKPG